MSKGLDTFAVISQLNWRNSFIQEREKKNSGEVHKCMTKALLCIKQIDSGSGWNELRMCNIDFYTSMMRVEKSGSFSACKDFEYNFKFIKDNIYF